MKKIIVHYKEIFSKLIPTKIYLRLLYKRVSGKKLDLKNPKTLNEKIQWKKIYDKNPIYTICADKYAVRDYIKKKIGEEYLIPLLYHTNDPNKINFEEIPAPFIIKSNHGSGHVIIVEDKEDIIKREIIEKCKKWLKVNIYYLGRESQYKNIRPKILIEKLLLDETGKVPTDYKFHCFNGGVEFIQVDTDRFGDHKRSFFDINWNLLPFIWCESKEKKPKYKINENVSKPKNLKKMIEIVEKLSGGFDYIRVDLYSVRNKIYFGELTFHHGAGFETFFPEEYDLIYGEKLKLNNLLKERKGNRLSK